MLTAPKGDLKPQKKPDMKQKNASKAKIQGWRDLFHYYCRLWKYFEVVYMPAPHTHRADLPWTFSSKHPGGHADNFRYSCVKWTIITIIIGNFLFITLLTCKEKKHLLVQLWKENIKSRVEKCSGLLPFLWAAGQSYEKQTPPKALAPHLHNHFFIIQGNEGRGNRKASNPGNSSIWAVPALPDLGRLLHLCVHLPNSWDSGNCLCCPRSWNGAELVILCWRTKEAAQRHYKAMGSERAQRITLE